MGRLLGRGAERSQDHLPLAEWRIISRGEEGSLPRVAARNHSSWWPGAMASPLRGKGETVLKKTSLSPHGSF